MIIQLHPDKPHHFALYEEFENRCKRMGERTGFHVSGEQIKESRTRWVTQPLMCGYFITDVLDAHVWSWVLQNYGRIGILICQAEGNQGRSLPMIDAWFEIACSRWIGEIEEALKRKVEFIELNVDAEYAQAWKRIVENHHHLSAQRTMTTFILDAQPIEVSKANGVPQ